MLTFPDEHELIGFFEAEPALASPDTPWCYNQLSFRTVRGSDLITCQIEPAYGEVRISWKQENSPRVSLKLNHVESISVHMAKNNDYMLVSGKDMKPSTLLKLRLKPHVSFEFECWHEP
jgi:hypothetical protein